VTGRFCRRGRVVFAIVRVLGFGTYDARVHPRAGILLDGLRAHGDTVTELNAPLGLDTAARVAILRQPWRLPVLVLRLFRSWAWLAWRSRRLPAPPDAVLVGYLGHFDVLLARWRFPRRRYPGTTIVLDHLISAADTAVDRGELGSVKGRLLTALDRAALGAADVVVVDTAEQLAVLPAEYRARAVVVPVGAPEAWFRWGPPPERVAGSLSVLFFGLFTPLQGAPVIGRALGLLADEPGITTILVGGGQDLAATRAAADGNRQVQWRDWVPPAELPALAAGADVCLGIFGTTPKALRVVPNKAFQGAAAGCALLTCDTPPQRRLLGDAADYVPPGDAVALAAALRRLAADPARVASLRAAAGALADSAFRPAAVVVPLRARLHSGVRDTGAR